MPDTAPKPPFTFYIGTNTAARDATPGLGIYRATLEFFTPSISSPELTAELPQPTFLAAHSHRPLLIAASEVYGGDGGSLSAFQINPDHSLSLLNTVSSGGRGPCHVVVDSENSIVYTTNHGSGSVASFRITADGTLSDAISVVERSGSGPHPERQTSSRPHSSQPIPDSPFLIVADLGTDEVVIYQVNLDTAEIDPTPVASAKCARPGAGPRHIAIPPKSNHFYVANEIDATVSLWRFTPHNHLLSEFDQTQIGDQNASAASEIQIHPNGQFLYTIARRPGLLAAFAIEPDSHHLLPIQKIATGGEISRHFGIDPIGYFLLVANTHSDSVTAFEIHPESGELNPLPNLDFPLNRPACILFPTISSS